MVKKDTTVTSGDEPKIDPGQVTMTPELMAIFESMIAKQVRSSAQTTGGPNSDAISVYGARDPKSIETVNVKRFNGKFVIGFKDLQNDPLKKHIPKYVNYQLDPIRKLSGQPYITLLLSNDGVDVEEKEMLISDYYNEREYFKAKVLDIKVEKQIIQNGLLGGAGGMAREIDERNNIVSRNAIKAEVMLEKRTYMVELPGFDKPVEFKEDFVA